MDRSWKYVIVSEGGVECPIIGMNILSHCQLVPIDKKAISAGFCVIHSENNSREVLVDCWGSSYSLGDGKKDLFSRGSIDEDLIMNEIKKHSSW